MSFEDYFRFEGLDAQEQYARFIAGLSPAMLQRNYLIAPEAVSLPERRVPSTMMGCDLCAGIVGTEALKLLLGRGELKPAPWSMQFDAYRHKLRFAWRPFGNANALQQLMLMLMLIRRELADAARAKQPAGGGPRAAARRAAATAARADAGCAPASAPPPG
jgi:hypothetical protein